MIGASILEKLFGTKSPAFKAAAEGDGFAARNDVPVRVDMDYRVFAQHMTPTQMDIWNNVLK